MIDLSNRKEVRRAEKAAAIARAQDEEVTKQIMSTPGGRGWMYRLLSRCCIFSTPFAGVPDRTAFNCGQQNIGLQIFNEVVTICPNQYVQMMQEAAQKDQLNDRHDSDDGVAGPDEIAYGRTASSGDYDPYAASDSGDTNSTEWN